MQQNKKEKKYGEGVNLKGWRKLLNPNCKTDFIDEYKIENGMQREKWRYAETLREGYTEAKEWSGKDERKGRRQGQTVELRITPHIQELWALASVPTTEKSDIHWSLQGKTTDI